MSTLEDLQHKTTITSKQLPDSNVNEILFNMNNQVIEVFINLNFYCHFYFSILEEGIKHHHFSHNFLRNT